MVTPGVLGSQTGISNSKITCHSYVAKNSNCCSKYNRGTVDSRLNASLLRIMDKKQVLSVQALSVVRSPKSFWNRVNRGSLTPRKCLSPIAIGRYPTRPSLARSPLNTARILYSWRCPSLAWEDP